MDNQFIRNIPSITQEEQMRLQSKCVLVVGCGGLGGYVIEYLTRLGVGQITVVDGDSFVRSNMNRQLYATENTMGIGKADAAKERIGLLNPHARVTAVCEAMTAHNAESLLAGHDAAVDALDSCSSRLVLEDACERLNISIVHGAVQGWVYQVAVAKPGSKLLHRLYADRRESEEKSILSFVPAACAAVQAAETVKLLLGRPTLPSGKMLYGDMESGSYLTLSI